MMVTQPTKARPLVSVVMPAYKATFLQSALESVQAQTYRPLELVVCDDCRGDEVRRVVEAFAVRADFPVHYQHNEKRLNETRNLARCVELAQGEYIKPLYDDDRLQPECIAQLLSAMQDHPDVVLASSRRRRIDALGLPLPDTLATFHPFEQDVLVDGPALVSFLVDHTINFIGEPSCVLCRRADLLAMGDGLTVLNGVRIQWVGDLALYVKLLREGQLAMLAMPLSDFRVSATQVSQIGRDRLGVGDSWHEKFRQMVRELGWYQPVDGARLIDVAPLSDPAARVPFDLQASLAQLQSWANVELQLSNWMQARLPVAAELRLIEERLEAHAGGPSIAVVVVDHSGDALALQKTLLTLEQVNVYKQVQSLVLPVAGQPPERWVAALNALIQRCDADWVMLVEPGVEFAANGLRAVALELLGSNECRAVYADELQRDARGRTGLLLRPGFNLDYLLSYPAGMSQHWLYQRQTLLQAGGFAVEFAEALEFELQLRLIEQGGLAGLGHVSEPILLSPVRALQDNPAERLALQRHLNARGYVHAQVGSQLAGRYQLDYGHAEGAGVSILIDVCEPLAALQRCVESLLTHTHGSYEILLLERGASDAATRDWLLAIEQMGEQQLRVLHYAPGTSAMAAANRAQAEARGDLLLFLSARAAAVDDSWIGQMLNHALRPEVGIVGAKLLSPQGRIEHAGLLLGALSAGQPPFRNESLDAAGYMNRLQVEQNLSAVSGDCLMIPRELFAELGGFAEEPLGQHWGAVDLCLRARQAGYLTVWSPRVVLMLDAPQQPSPCPVAEQDLLFERWLPQLASDPAYNPLFSLHKPFALGELPLTRRPLASWRPLPVAIAHPADRFGCGHYRVIQPFLAMQQAGLIEGTLAHSYMPMEDLQRFQPDLLLFQRQYTAEQIENIARIRRFSQAFRVYELDDYLPGVPAGSAHRQETPKDVLRSMRRALDLMDRFVVSTPALAEACAGLHRDIVVVENRLPLSWWIDLQGQRRTGERPRVGWAGGAGHGADLAMIADVVRELAGEVDWVFMGMCPERLRPYVREHHPGVEIDQYPAALAALNLDLAIAPLEGGLFNECKSNLRLLEYGACGFPVVCSDIGNYRGDLPVTRVKNRFKDWVDAIRSHITDLDASAAMGDTLRQAVHRRWMLDEDALRHWRKAWLDS